MSVETEPLPPVPEHTPILRGDMTKFKPGDLVHAVWARWLGALREKINVLNASLVSLGEVTGVGIVTKNGDAWAARTLTGTAGEIDVAGGDGTSDPTISLANSGVTAGTLLGGLATPVLTVDAKGRITGAAAMDYTSVATAGASPTGFLKINVKVSGTAIDVYIPYYPAV